MIAASIRAVGPVAQFLGLIEALTGRLDEAIVHFVGAAALAGVGDLGPSLVRARLAFATSLERRGAPGDEDDEAPDQEEHDGHPRGRAAVAILATPR